MTKNEQIIIGVSVSIVLTVTVIGMIRYHQQKNKKELQRLSAFDSPDIKGSGACMDKEFIKKLERLSEVTDLPIFKMINSGARSAYWNSKVGGVANSSHKMPTCKAADIKAPNKRIRYLLVYGAKKVGFKRIGIGKTFVHLDSDQTKKQYAVWGYPSGTRPEFNPFV